MCKNRPAKGNQLYMYLCVCVCVLTVRPISDLFQTCFGLVSAYLLGHLLPLFVFLKGWLNIHLVRHILENLVFIHNIVSELAYTVHTGILALVLF